MFFADLAQFAAFMGSMRIQERIVDEAARGAVAALYAKEARARLGDPARNQPDLAPSTQTERERLGYSPDGTLLRTGELRDSIHWMHDSARVTTVGSTSEKAVWHEFGTNRIPARPFLGRTAQEYNVEGFALYNERIGNWLKGRGALGLVVRVD